MILLWTRGRVSILVVLYSINVFLTFSLSLLGLCIYWWRNRQGHRDWGRRLALSATGLAVSGGILAVTVVEKFTEGGWLTVVITSAVIALCFLIRHHYDEVRKQLRKIDDLFASKPEWDGTLTAPRLDPSLPAAVFLVGQNRGVGMHALLWVQRLFPNHFRNFIFVAVGEVDAQSYDGQGALRTLQYKIDNSLRYYVNFCHANGLAAASFQAYGTDPVEELAKLTERVMQEYPNSGCFDSKLFFARENFVTRLLHNQVTLAVQSRLRLRGQQMVILPMKVA